MSVLTIQQQKAGALLAVLEELYPDARCALYFNNPFELLIATILSAQCTDVRVNQVTPGLFARYPDPAAIARADLGELEAAIRSTGFFRNKARNILGCALALLERHDGQVPRTMEDLVELPGVGRKTANVVLGNIFNISSMVVDTHVKRLANRFGWTRSADP
ncbi:endonuclease III domain-containing protein, partial [Trichloromonas sp.]|uniref:endonuclease III domain-containing protein n=1 Tax=Trichloromonas sp. TaxID=3069249 RepID=UPI003D818435